VITKYVPGEGLGVVAKRVGAGPGAVTTWLHTDRLGSITAATDGAGAATLSRTYRPYGETLGEAGGPESRGWIDQRNDPETGLTYLHARYFDPKIGRFLSPDRSSPTEPGVGTNPFLYGFGNPINLTDRFGRMASCGNSRGNPYTDEREGPSIPDCSAFDNGPLTWTQLFYLFSGLDWTPRRRTPEKPENNTCKPGDTGCEAPAPTPTPAPAPAPPAKPATRRSPEGTCQTVGQRLVQNLSMTYRGAATAGAEQLLEGNTAGGLVTLATTAAVGGGSKLAESFIISDMASSIGASTFTGMASTFLVGSANSTIAPGSVAAFGGAAGVTATTVATAAGVGLSLGTYALGTAIGSWVEAAGPYLGDGALSMTGGWIAAMPRCE
jgi:RHS repeat-associated protein